MQHQSVKIVIQKTSVSPTHNHIAKFSFLHFLLFKNRGTFLNAINLKMIKSHRHRVLSCVKTAKNLISACLGAGVTQRRWYLSFCLTLQHSMMWY